MSFQSRDTKAIRWLKLLLAGVGVIALLIAMAAIALFFVVRASVPILDGDKPLANLEKAVTITRDANGMVSITADTSRDAIRALGYVHGQERFFEMDLARRSAAGELSALLGGATIPMDKQKRAHRLRARRSGICRRPTGGAGVVHGLHCGSERWCRRTGGEAVAVPRAAR